MRLARISLLGLLGLGFSAANVHAVCLSNGYISGPENAVSGAPAFNFGSASYNHVTGTFSASTSGGGEMGNGTNLIAREIYWLVGPSSATPISFEARVKLTGSASASYEILPGGLQGCFTSGMRFVLRNSPAEHEVIRSSTTSPCQGVTIDETAKLQLQKLPGETFILDFDLYVGNSTFQSASATGMLSFALPPGYSIASCQGFAGPTVPAAPASWGQLKHTYR